MKPAIECHEPTPEFRDRLEWQITSALRCENRFAAPIYRRTAPLGAAVAILAVLATGGIALVASEHVQDARQRNALVAAAAAEESLLARRLDLARAAYEEARSRFEIGTATREAVQETERNLRALEAALQRLRLDVAEIQTTSTPPRNDLQAPVVGKRDFVRERLQLDLTLAQRSLMTSELALQEAKRRFEVGMAQPAALLQAEAELVQAQAKLELVKATIALRERAVQGTIKGEAVALAHRRLELTVKRDHVERQMRLARDRIAEVRGMVEIGLATQLDLKRAEVDLLEREVELERLKRELESLLPQPKR